MLSLKISPLHLLVWVKSRGIVSFSDSPAASGRLFFYLTPMDETAQNLKVSMHTARWIICWSWAPIAAVAQQHCNIHSS
jgi:hypothetical protein